MSTLYTNALNPDQQKVYQKLTNFADEFVLAGGTAIMLQINHRKSIDFDCFSEKELPPTILPKVKNVFGDKISIQVDTPELLLFIIHNQVKIDFVYYPYPPQFAIIKEGPIPLFNLLDLATDKARTISRRAIWRDYVDLFFFLKWNIFSFPDIIKATQKRFGGEFNEKLFLEQLIFFDDLELTPIAFQQESYSDQEIQRFLQDTVAKYIKKKLTRPEN